MLGIQLQIGYSSLSWSSSIKQKNKLWEKSLGGKNWNYFLLKRASNFHFCQWNNKNTLHNTLNIQLPYINDIRYVRHGIKKPIIISFCKNKWCKPIKFCYMKTLQQEIEMEKTTL